MARDQDREGLFREPYSRKFLIDSTIRGILAYVSRAWLAVDNEGRILARQDRGLLVAPVYGLPGRRFADCLSYEIQYVCR